MWVDGFIQNYDFKLLSLHLTRQLMFYAHKTTRPKLRLKLILSIDADFKNNLTSNRMSLAATKGFEF